MRTRFNLPRVLNEALERGADVTPFPPQYRRRGSPKKRAICDSTKPSQASCWLPFLRKIGKAPRAARGDQVRREGAELVEVAHRSSDGARDQTEQEARATTERKPLEAAADKPRVHHAHGRAGREEAA